MKIELWNKFSGIKISGHRTVLAAVKARIAHASKLRESNSHTNYAIRYSDGLPVSMNDCMVAEEALRA